MASTVPIVREAGAFRTACDEARARGARVGFVPTMGALHEGHLALVDEAKRRAGFVAVSIFVNPTQFGPSEDLARYPRDLARDCELLAPRGVDLVFAPEPSEIYPDGDETRVRVGALASTLCGPFRPGHFEGVATVVTKLLVLAGRTLAVFGRKDYQQLAIIRRVVRDLFLPAEVVGVPIVREPDGLAMSSRNTYLSTSERARALSISRGLVRAQAAFARGERAVSALVAETRAEIEPNADAVQYVDLVDATSLAAIPGGTLRGAGVLAVACQIGKTRLIDNIVFENAPPLVASGG